MTLNKYSTFGFALVAISILSGCASITRGTTDGLTVESVPSQAEIKIYRTNGSFGKNEIKNNSVLDEKNPSVGPIVGKTPQTFKLARKGKYKVEISKAGYKTAEVDVTNIISGSGGAGMAGNLLFGGIIGAGIDASNGSMKDLTPNPVSVTLEPISEQTPSIKNGPDASTNESLEKLDDSDAE